MSDEGLKVLAERVAKAEREQTCCCKPAHEESAKPASPPVGMVWVCIDLINVLLVIESGMKNKLAQASLFSSIYAALYTMAMPLLASVKQHRSLASQEVGIPAVISINRSFVLIVVTEIESTGTSAATQGDLAVLKICPSD